MLTALLVATMFLTGCIWLRLLALKNQLAEFDRYVKVDDRQGLGFEFLEPVLYSRDVRSLLEMEPTLKATNQDTETWSWTFQKTPATNTEPRVYDLTFTTSFQNNKLSRLAIPERLLTFVPKALIVGMVRAFGNAEVDQKNRSANAQWRSDEPHGDTNRLSRADLNRLLGPPLVVEESKEDFTHGYEYRLLSPSLTKGEPMTARAQCRFAKETEKLTRVEIRYSGLRLNVTFDSPK